MNRRKSELRTPASAYVALIAAAMIAAGGGVMHAFYKNRQIQVAREIDLVEREMQQYRLDMKTSDMRMDQLLNRYAIRQQLEEAGSSLRAIPVEVIEVLPGRDPLPAVAVAAHP